MEANETGENDENDDVEEDEWKDTKGYNSLGDSPDGSTKSLPAEVISSAWRNTVKMVVLHNKHAEQGNG